MYTVYVHKNGSMLFDFFIIYILYKGQPHLGSCCMAYCLCQLTVDTLNTFVSNFARGHRHPSSTYRELLEDVGKKVNRPRRERERK